MPKELRSIISIFLTIAAILIAVVGILLILLVLDVIEQGDVEFVFERAWRVSIVAFVVTSLISLLGNLRGKV